VPDTKRTITDLAAMLGVSASRANEVLQAVDQVRTGATHFVMSPNLGARTIGVSIFDQDHDQDHDLDHPRTEQTLPVDEVTDPAASELPEPHVIATRYEELGLLGRGGMGEVHRVRDRRFDRILAMKVMRTDRSLSRLTTGLFLREARIEARLQHPGVPPVYDRGTLPDGRPWYTMKQVEGERLSDAICTLHDARSAPQRYSMLLRQVLRAFGAVCSTVAYAHEQGVVHRDIKPPNIMLGAFGEVLLLDWGLAVELSSEAARSPTSVRVAGTPNYMSPEQARGDSSSVAPGTDIYALGATLYHILTGKPPYHGLAGVDVLEQLVTAVPPTPIPQSPGHDGLQPAFLVRLCQRAMDPQQSARLLNAQAMAEAVQDWLETVERQERGRKEIARANELAEAGRTERARAVTLWLEASELLDDNATPQAPGWGRWLESQAAFIAAKRLQDQRTRALEASLAHWGDLKEARLPLAWHYSTVALKARERGAIDAARTAWTRALQHLNALSSPHSEQQQSRIDSHRKSVLHIEQARRGSQIGRESLRDDLLKLHACGERLVTLHGEPGVGKSSVLIEHGLLLQDDPHRPIYANFQTISDVHSVEQVVGLVVGGPDFSVSDARPIHGLIGDQSILLLLDNIDQCREDVDKVVAGWLRECPALKVVCTSRVPLRCAGSLPQRVPRLGRLGAIELLVRHALRADPDLDLNTLDRESLVAVVERLDGIPLAIELAGARLSSFRLDELRARLDRRLDILRSGGARAGGLDAAMAISWDGLSPAARTALAQASLFRSGMDRTAAEQVLQIEGGESAVWNALEELVQHNLLRASRSDDDRTRYLLSPTVWSWANARLHEEPCDVAALDELAGRHASCFAAMHDVGRGRSYASLERAFELENFVVAALRGPPDAAMSCAHLACGVLLTKGPVFRSVEIIEQLLARSDFQQSQRRELLILLGRCLRVAGRIEEARERLSQAQVLSSELLPDDHKKPRVPDDLGIAIAQALADGLVAADEHRYLDASHHYKQAAAWSEQTKALGAQAQAHAGLSMLPPEAGHLDETRTHFEKAVALARSNEDEPLALKIIGNYGLSLFRRGQLDQALARFAEAEVGHRLVDNHHAVATFSMNQGILLQRMGRPQDSAQAFDRSLLACDTGADLRIRASVLGSQASLALRQGNYAQAYRLATKALEWQLTNGDTAMARRTRRLLAGICIDIGQLEGAEQHLESLTQAKEDTQEPRERIAIEVNRAALLLCHPGREEEARSILESAARDAEHQYFGYLRLLALINLGDALLLQGHGTEATEIFTEALSIGNTDDAYAEFSGIAMGALAVEAASRGDDKRARELLQEAAPLVQDWALERIRWQIRAGLVAAYRGDNLEALHRLHEVRQDIATVGIGTHSPIRGVLHTLEHQLRQRSTELIATVGHTATVVESEQKLVLSGLSELALLEQEACHFDAAEQLLDRAEQVALALDDLPELTHIILQRLNLARERGHTSAAATYGKEALKLVKTTMNRNQELQIRTNLGIVALERGELEQSQEHLDVAECIAKELGDDRGHALVLCNLGLLKFAQERYSEAEELFRLAGRAFDEIGLDRYAMLNSGNRGDALLRLNKLDLAEDLLEKAIVWARQYRHDVAEGAFLGSLAELRARQGRCDEAMRLVEQGRGLAKDVPLENAKFLAKAAIAAALAGNRAEADAFLAEALQQVDALGDRAASSIRFLLRIAGAVLDDPDRHRQAGGQFTGALLKGPIR